MGREREREREREIEREIERERERFDPLWPVEGYNLTSRNVCA